MALDATKWQVRTDKSIRYIGGSHGTSTTNYVTVLELHRWLQDLADDASVADHGSDDYMDITTLNPSDKKFDTIITLTNGYTLDDGYTTPASEYIYGGSIIQGSGGTEAIYDGIRIVANRGVKVNVIQNGAVLSNAFWNNVPDSEKTDSTATVVGVNSSGQKVLNVSDGSLFTAGDTIMIGSVVDEEYLIDSISSNALTLTENLGTATSGGETVYFSVRGINPDAANGVAMQFMVKVKTAGALIDNGALWFTTREWYSTYSGFRKPSTSRGNNDIPLGYAADLNNTTPLATVAGWSTINNVTQGYNAIDVNQDTTDEYYYSEWNRDTYSINQFYERMKYLTRAGETGTIYGLAGELFRGITHEVDVDTPVSTFNAFEPVSWSGGTGLMLAIDSVTAATKMWIQLRTGVPPTDGQTISGDTSSASVDVNVTVVERPISTPFCGASTGTSLVGAFGFSLEYADLGTNDKITALDGVTRQPPNNVQFVVSGVLNGYRVLVGPEDGASGLKYDQLTLNGALTGVTTSVVVNEAIPANTPTSGTIRILRNDGQYTRHPYSQVNPGTKTFTITSYDFTSNNANNGANVFISYIDAAATGATISYNTVQTVTQTLYVEARFGGTGPGYTDSIKPAKTTGTLGTTGGSATVSPVSDA